MLRFVSLEGQTPVARGLKRAIYIHPDDPSLLIKVPKYEYRRAGAHPWWRRPRQRYGVNVAALREVAEYIALFERNPRESRLIERVIGFVETDLGLGLVVEALRTREGELAPSVAVLLRDGRFNEKVQAKLKAFVDELEDSSIIFTDFHTGNIVYAYDEALGDERCVLVDGLGDKQLIPFATLSRAIHHRNKRRYFRDLEVEIGRLAAGKKRRVPKAERRWFHHLR